MADELVTIIITGNSTEAVASAERASAAIGGIGAAADRSSAQTMAMSQRLKGASGTIAGVGKGLTKYVTAPILGIGAASVILSRQFGGSMRLISTQAGASRKEMEHMKSAVLDMVADGRVKQSPNELAEALFHIESVGYRGSKALNVLKSSADLAAVGQSNLETTTYALVSAMETGIKGTESMHKTIGMLNAIVGTGDMKMEDLTQSLSSGVLISAKQVGLSLQDVGAALDMMTARGMPATVAATRLRMTFTLMAAPTEKAKKALESVGLDSEALAKKMQGPSGLIGALQLLQSHMHGLSKIERTQLLSEAFGGARSGTTMMALLQNLGDVKERFDQLGRSTDNFKEKLKEVRDAPGFKMEVAWHQLETTLIKLGDHILPVIVPAFHDFGEAVAAVGSWFSKLDTGTQETIVKVALVAAAMGPLIRVVGFYVKSLGLVVGWVEKLTASTPAQVEANTALTASYVELSASIRAAASAQGAFSATQSGLLVPGNPAAATAKSGGRFSGIMGKAGRGVGIGLGGMVAGQMIGGKAGNLVSKVGMGAGAGSMFGLPGAAVGAAVGAVVADVELLTGAEKKLSPLQIKLAHSSQEVVKWWHKQHEASKGLVQAEENVGDAKRHQKGTAKDLAAAEKHLTNIRDRFGPLSKPAERAEWELARARNGNAQAVKRVENAERLKGAALQMYKAVTRSTIAEERHQIHLLQERRHNLELLFKKEQMAGASNQRLAAIGKQGLKVVSALKDEQKKYAQTLQDASSKAGAKWAKHMKEMPTSLVAFGKEIAPLGNALERLGDNPGPKKIGRAFKQMHKETAPLMQHMEGLLDNQKRKTEEYEDRTEILPRHVVRSWGALGQAIVQNSEKSDTAVKKVSKAQDHVRDSARQDLPKAAGSYKDFASEGSEALADLGGSFNSFLEAFKQKPVDFHVSKGGGPEGKAEGGFFIGGSDRRDHVHALLGSDEAVVNVHQQPYVQVGLAASAAMGLQPFGSLGELFAGVSRPNHLAGGGFASKVPREVMGPPTDLTPGGQKGLDMARHAGLEYLRKHAGGDRSLQALVRSANAIDSKHFPYKWGGGHQASPAPWLVPYDCSGATSALVQHSGWSNIPTMVSGGFESVGKPGRGKFSILANSEHVYSVIGGRAFGTSEENPGGGAGWISGYTYRPGFTVRHLPLVGEGEVGEGMTPKGHRGAGQKQKKGLARGGFAGGSIASTIGRFAKGGFAGTPLRFSTGGPVPPKSGELVGASYYGGPTDHVSGTTGAAGVSLPGKMSFAELAMGHALGGLPFHSKLKIGYAGKSVIAEKLDIGAGGDAVGGKNRAIDLWYETANAIGMPGTAVVKVAPAGGSATTKSEENVPAVFHGVKTGSLSFGAIPKTLHGVKKEIAKREAEMDRYHKALHAAKDKPKVEHALLACLNALRNRLKQLRRAASLLRRKAAQRKVVRKLAGKLKKITGAEREMEGAQRVYEGLSQYAEQVVALEPLQPTLPATATEAEQAAAEKTYVQQLTDYIAHQEKPAYGNVLGSLADWRNSALGGEGIATRLEAGWEKEVRGIDGEIDGVNTLTNKVSGDVRDWRGKHPGKGPKDYPDWLRKEIKKEHEERARLPMLRFRDREVRKALGEARETFYPGRKSPITPPAVPLDGTGSIEDMLVTIQGLHWPDFHSKLKPLPSNPVAGAFGGAIFDTQMAMRELDLKIGEAQAGLAGAGGGGGAGENEALAEAIREQNAIDNRKGAIEAGLGDVLKGFTSEFGKQLPFVGAFADGGMVPGPVGAPGWAVVHGGETINKVGAGSDTHIYLGGDLAALVEASAPGMAKKSDQWIGRQMRRLSFAPGG